MPGEQIPQNQMQKVNVQSIAAKYKSKYDIHFFLSVVSTRFAFSPFNF